MARPKKVETDTASIVEEKNSTVEVETPVTEETLTTEKNSAVKEIEEKEDKSESEKTVTEKKIKKFGDDEKVVIKCVSLACKKLSLPTRSVEFDDKGKCEVTGAEANRLLSIPGYELSK